MSGPPIQQGEHRGWSNLEPLCEREQWVVTKDKRPICPAKGWQQLENQLPFQDACRKAKKRNGEVAFVLNPKDPFVILDFDHVRQTDPGRTSGEVENIIERLSTYTELSRSGTGFHLVCIGAMLPDKVESGQLHEKGKIEVFDSGQYVVLTGNQVRPFDPIRDFNEKGTTDDSPLLELQREYLPERTELSNDGKRKADFDLENVSDQSLYLTPQEIRRTIEEYKKSGNQPAKRALNRWDSPEGSSLEFASSSEADLGFVSDLAFWCREDAHLIDQCFRQSNRMRDKWLEVHYADGRTYGEMTIRRAIRSNYDSFSGHYVRSR
ncbi:hypothetical protein JMJ58_18585 [Haloterrigena salifodinae]|uniref:NrS-1 polymerase-like HBD domain-containing protein n=1 Tax=Haloterrigena salifodinae TaxID=2675099 RepID=A0A8T8DZU7_9EURY|nr:hypothetical protein [Haloterrigena salifodinae]QRV14897.1 hypothetical protein JMJ58_18585 [Haloterrigena salifodinae]